MKSHSVYRPWLQLQCEMVGGCQQGLLLRGTEATNDRLVAHWPESSPVEQAIAQAAENACKIRKTYSVSDSQYGVYLASPITLDGAHWGTVVLHLNQNTPAVLQAALKLLKWGFAWLHLLTTLGVTSNARSQTPETYASDSLLKLLTQAIKDRSFEETAITTVNHLAAAFAFERVSFCLVKHNTAEIIAVSFNAQFDPKSEPAQLIVEAMNEAIAENKNIYYPNNATTVDRAHHELAQNNNLQSCGTFILGDETTTIGAITVEQKTALTIPENGITFIQRSLESIANLYMLRQEISERGLTPKSSTLRSLRSTLLNRRSLKKLMGGFLVIFIAASCLPASHTIRSNAVLLSTNRHLVTTPFDSYLKDVLVKPGDNVHKGQVLARLNNDDLNLERKKLAGQIQQLQFEFDSALALSDRSHAAITSTKIDQVRVQLELAQHMLNRTTLVASSAGIVVSEDISQSIGAPTNQGSTLFEISDAQNFSVQLYVNEKQVSHIQHGLQGTLKLTSLPDKAFNISVRRITPISEFRNGENYFKVDATIATSSPLLRPGMTGKSKLTIGTRKLGWIWFHGIWHRARTFLWL